MRLLASLMSILALIIGLGFWLNHSLQTSADDISRQVELVASAMKQDNWEAALSQTKVLEKLWEQKARWWPVFLDHQEIDNIEFSLAKVKEYVFSRDHALALGQLSELRLMVQHIPNKEKVSLENIL